MFNETLQLYKSLSGEFDREPYLASTILIVYVILITLITFDVRTVQENSFLNKLTSTPKGVPVGNFRGLKIRTSGKCHKLSGKNHYIC